MATQHTPRPVTVMEIPTYSNGYRWKLEEDNGNPLYLSGPGAPQPSVFVGDKGTVLYTNFSSSMSGFSFTLEENK